MSASLEKPDSNENAKDFKWIITIHSQKGGVGKTLIALYLARRMAEKQREGLNRRSVLIDADLTGTSLAHAIDLRAPSPWESTGERPDPVTRDDTRKRLKEWSERPDEIGRSRRSCSSGPRPWVLNDYLFCDPLSFKKVFKKVFEGEPASLRAWDLLWSWDTTQRKDDEEKLDVDLGNLRIIPSSGFHNHVSQCLPHIYKEDVTRYLDHRLTELVWKLWQPLQIREQQEEKAFDAVIIDCPPTLSGISLGALNLHGSLERRSMLTSPHGQQIAIIHLALFISSADVQDVVGLWQGLDSLLAEEAGPVYDLGDGETKKTNGSVRLDEIRIVVNRVPDTLIPPEALLGTGKRAKDKDVAGLVPSAGDTFNLKDSPDALRYFRGCAESFLQFRSSSLKDSSILDRLLRLDDTAFVIPYDQKSAELLVVRRAKYGLIPQLEPLFSSVKEAKPREES